VVAVVAVAVVLPVLDVVAVVEVAVDEAPVLVLPSAVPVEVKLPAPLLAAEEVAVGFGPPGVERGAVTHSVNEVKGTRGKTFTPALLTVPPGVAASQPTLHEHNHGGGLTATIVQEDFLGVGITEGGT
jgi:hypothetical protein